MLKDCLSARVRSLIFGTHSTQYLSAQLGWILVVMVLPVLVISAFQPATSRSRPPPCYKFEMSNIVERWLLFEYVGPEFTPFSKPFKTREQAEKAREKYPERLRKTIGFGVIRTKS